MKPKMKNHIYIYMNDHYSKWNHQWRRICVWSRNQTVVNLRSFWSSHSASPLFAPKHQTQNNAWVVCWKIHHLVRWFSSFKPPFSSDMKIGISPRILVWHCLTSSMKDRTVSVLVNSASFTVTVLLRVKGKKNYITHLVGLIIIILRGITYVIIRIISGLYLLFVQSPKHSPWWRVTGQFCRWRRSGREESRRTWRSWCAKESTSKQHYNGCLMLLKSTRLNPFYRRNFRSQTSDNMDRWKAEMGRVREKRRVEERRSEKRKGQKKEDADARKGRKVAIHCVFPNDLWLRRVEFSRLAKSTRSHVARWEMKSCTPLCAKRICKCKN